MTKTINYLEDQLVGVRWGTITPAVVDLVRLDYHGQNMPIKHLAHTTMDSGRIMVRAFDPTVLGSIDKALQKAGFNSYVFSKEAVCVAVPPPSGDQKNEVIARVKRVGEEAKVSIRNIRKKAKQKLKDADSENERRQLEVDLQKLTDKAVSLVDEIIENKIGSM